MPGNQEHEAAGAFGAWLGVSEVSRGEEGALILLPYREENTNPGGILHGGVAASLSALGALAANPLGKDAKIISLEVCYLSAAQEDLETRSRLLRRGKTLAFVEVEVASGEKTVAKAMALLGSHLGEPRPLPRVEPEEKESEVGPLAEMLAMAPFMGRLGVKIEHMKEGCSRVRLPFSGDLTGESGGLHEGAALSLMDTAGAMAALSLRQGMRASTPALEAQFMARPPAASSDLLALGQVVHQEGEMFWVEVQIACATSQSLLCRGTVFYRIPE